MRTCDLTCPLICSFRHHSPPHTSPCTCRPQCTMQCSTAKLQQHLYCWLLRSAFCSSHLHVGFSFRQRADSNYYISSPASYCLTLGLHCPVHNVSVRPVMHCQLMSAMLSMLALSRQQCPAFVSASAILLVHVLLGRALVRICASCACCLLS
jgi:hypothetical protein